MKNKMKLLIKDGLNKKINTKWFRVVNLILLVIIVGLINIDSIIKYFGGNFDDPVSIYVIDNTNEYLSDLKVTYESYDLKSLNSESEIVKSDKSFEELKEEINSEDSNDMILELNYVNDKLDVNITSYGYVDAITLELLSSTINTIKTNKLLMQSSLSKEELTNIYEEVNINRIYLGTDKNEDSELVDYLSNLIIPMFIVPFFLLIVMITQMIGAEINEEKSSKSMEIIITSVPARVHFLSKVITANIYAILQSLLFVLYIILGLIVRKTTTGASLIGSLGSSTSDMVSKFLASSSFENLIKCIPITIVMILLSYLAYSLLAGILASMTTNQEDFQQLQTPMMIIIMASYMLAILASSFEKSTFIIILSMVPFVSCILSPVLLMMGQIGLIHILIAIALLILILYLLIKYGLRIYKVGILNYNSSNLWKKILEGIKSKE